ncbi:MULTISPECIES: ribonuclease HII [unclassified Pseudofrankia]|uniref:ribonuclease HII n=1 Tax=unclassified Pseudofrankia TaxID=2994372 RepID=UPI0008DA6A2B|nr:MULTISPECIES: ribonuclease HII [unclassified Pseudofrankia]MDT3443791.1 ribonuclease HII [Pseudofrankia sp. BMG5.37]OHV50076.1 ribonuclease HII [Pseudofrankia sp. BMG5.36]
MRPPGVVIRRDSGLFGYERALARRGLGPVAGVDEAGRGACAGPLVVAAVILDPRRTGRLSALADSKLLTERVRERVYDDVTAVASAWSVVVIPAADIDRHGLHVMNIAGMRRAVARLAVRPGYVLVDGFPVPGIDAPSLAVRKGDRVAGCVAAASVIAKVTRDRIMCRLHERYGEYDFAQHKGYVTAAHAAALALHGPCKEHRLSYVNVQSLVAQGGDFRSVRLEETVAVAGRQDTETV